MGFKVVYGVDVVGVVIFEEWQIVVVVIVVVVVYFVMCLQCLVMGDWEVFFVVLVGFVE